MKRFFASLTCTLLLLSCAQNQPGVTDAAPPSRIVSFAPSVTEILYELGLGDRVIGVTPFCKYPPEAALVTNKVSGHADRNYEAILRLKPDLSIIIKEQTEMAAFFDSYNMRYIKIGSDSSEEILEAIEKIADACGVKDAGDSLITALRERILEIKKRAALNDRYDGDTVSSSISHKPDGKTPNGRPKMLLCIDRANVGSGSVGACYAAGGRSFYNELMDIAGGVNAIGDVPHAYPHIGAEAIIRLDPDIIIDLSSAYLPGDAAIGCEDFAALKSVAAVRSNRVHCLKGDYLTIPGPRFVQTLETFAQIITPDL